jgi:hypothetical protein
MQDSYFEFADEQLTSAWRGLRAGIFGILESSAMQYDTKMLPELKSFFLIVKSIVYV